MRKAVVTLCPPRLQWLWNRLRCMSAAEVGYRLRQAGLYRMVRHGWLGRRVPSPLAGARLLAGQGAPAGLAPAPYLAEADAIVAGRVTLFAAAGFEPGPVPQWNRDPLTGVTGPARFGAAIAITDRALVGDIKHVWELNRHLHLVRLAQAYALSGEARYAQALARQLDAWLSQCPPLTGPNWTSALELGIRLINWSMIWQWTGGADGALFAGAQGAALRQRWLDSIYFHCDYIARHLSRHSSANNHLVGELAGLYVAARSWPCWPQSRRWARQGRRELEQQVLAQYADDGVNREQAFSYHVFTAEFLLVAGLCGERTDDPFSPAYWQRLRRALHFLDCARDAGGHVPMVGDADDGMVFRLVPGAGEDRGAMLLALGRALFDGAPEDACGSWLLAGTRIAVAPDAAPWSDWDFAAGGYLLFGRAFGQHDEIKGMVDCGPLGYLGIAAHGHADALAVTLSIGGQPCLVDPGTYSYWQEQRWRDYFRGTSAHNTVRVDGLDQSVSGGRFMWTRKARCRTERRPDGPTRFDFVGVHDGYTRLPDPVRHRRAVRFDADTGTLTVCDTLDGRQRHRMEQFWHFAPDLQVTLEQDTLLVQGQRFRLRGQFAGAALGLELVRGQEHPPLGWYSSRYEDKQATTVLRVWTEQSDVPLEARFTINNLP